MATLRVPVFVEHWQIECCGTPPAIGDRVDWTLLFVADDPQAAPDPEEGVTLDAVAVPVLGRHSAVLEDGEAPTRLDHGDLHTFWAAPGRIDGPLRVTGRLTEDHHGGVSEPFPRTAGSVARVRVVSRRYVLHPTEPRTWVPGPEAPVYRDVERSPKWFAGHVDQDRPMEVGVLVNLLVPGP